MVTGVRFSIAEFGIGYGITFGDMLAPSFSVSVGGCTNVVSQPGSKRFPPAEELPNIYGCFFVLHTGRIYYLRTYLIVNRARLTMVLEAGCQVG